jgi:hypothetical protein
MKKCKELEEENKTLKECNKSQSEVINNVFIPQKERLEEENKKLKENYAKLDKVASENVRTLDELEAKRIELEEENKTLKDNVEFLHQCLDDRDKSIQYAEEENKKLKKYYDRDKEELMESCY